MESSIRPEAAALLGLTEQLEAAMDSFTPRGSTVTVSRPAEEVVTIAFFLARPTFGSVRLLMAWSLTAPDADRTEDAAVLVRKLLFLLGRCCFVLGTDDERERADQDLRPARIELNDYKKHLTAMREGLVIEFPSADPEVIRDREDKAAAWRKSTTEWEDETADLEARIVREAGEASKEHVSRKEETGAGIVTYHAKPPLATIDVLKQINPVQASLWRQLSDVAHGGVLGRAYQRRDLTFGVRAEPDRQDMVMHVALWVMMDLYRLWLQVMGQESEAFDRFEAQAPKYA